MDHLKKIQTIFKEAHQKKIGSAYQLTYGKLGLNRYHFSYGVTDFFSGKAIHSQSVFDLASLTKVIATTSLYALSHDQNPNLLNENLHDCPFFELKLREVLQHHSGLKAWAPIYQGFDFWKTLKQESQDRVPGICYSDLGFLWLYRDLILRIGAGLDVAFDQMVKPKLPEGSLLHYRRVGNSHAIPNQEVVATEVHPLRGMIQGIVHDDNAERLGGVSAHAGLFGNADSVADWIEAFLLGKIASFQSVKSFLNDRVVQGDEQRVIGFDGIHLKRQGTLGYEWSDETFGHLGFTGTALWFDLLSGHYAVLLTNRIHPSRQDLRIRDLRRAVFSICRSV